MVLVVGVSGCPGGTPVVRARVGRKENRCQPRTHCYARQQDLIFPINMASVSVE